MEDILKIKFFSWDLNREVTYAEYFGEVLLELLKEGECFSGKRPLGNSQWYDDLAFPLVKLGLVNGKIDRDDEDSPEYLDECDYKEVDKILREQVIKPLLMTRSQ
jgi:hypothetical protein